jgi:predicted HicB family RNase H-like nuclease
VLYYDAAAEENYFTERARTERRHMTKSDRIYIRVDPELKAKLQELADRDHRTLSNYIELVLKREIEKQTKQG